MSYKCMICGSNEVDKAGGVCELCALGPDPYVQGGMKAQPTGTATTTDSSESDVYIPKSRKKRTILIGGGGATGNPMTPVKSRNTPPAQTHASSHAVGHVTQNTPPATRTKSVTVANTPITAGIVKNIVVDTQKRSFLGKWFKALFCGIPFSLDDTATMFQVFPDYTGTALNAQGNACDQVIVYGRVAAGAVCENNNVEVYGRRDKSNIVVAKRVKNVASGTLIDLQRVIGAGVVRILTLLVLALLAGLFMSLGTTGVVWLLILILCFTNLPKVLKILGVIFGILFSFFRRK